MPECLREFLESLRGADADAVTEYLDSNESACSEMIDVVQESTA